MRPIRETLERQDDFQLWPVTWPGSEAVHAVQGGHSRVTVCGLDFMSQEGCRACPPDITCRHCIELLGASPEVPMGESKKMTRDEFEASYYRAHRMYGRFAIPCACGDTTCLGWQMAHDVSQKVQAYILQLETCIEVLSEFTGVSLQDIADSNKRNRILDSVQDGAEG